jgi:2-polyprenyl-6-hydroxyphenyl methylase/3-demethylubiquinone-9 3-methyltransferase
MSTLRAHGWRWRPGGGYYTRSAAELEASPLLPDFRMRRDQDIAALLGRFLPATPDADVLELGCGASRWLPYMARVGCRVTGIDYESSAATLAEANLRGVGASGTVLCRDAFDPHGNQDLVGRFDLVYSLGLLEHFDDIGGCLREVVRYVRPGGVVVTIVPNLQGLNWLLQRYGDLRTLQTHVIYDVERLRRPHEAAGLATEAAGYAGFYDGFVSAVSPSTPPRRRRLHHTLGRTTNLAAHAWLRLTRGRYAPDLAWTSPVVYYAGRRSGPSFQPSG